MEDHLRFINELLVDAGKVVRSGRNSPVSLQQKQNQSHIVTAADTQSEARILETITARFPQDTIISEEAGFRPGASDGVWMIDPLDGTSNFAAGLPWVGILVARLEKWQPVAAGMYLPFLDELYLAAAGSGATKNGNQVSVTPMSDPKRSLATFQVDYTDQDWKRRKDEAYITALVSQSRNLRMTNSCMDFAMLASGQTGVAAGTCSCVWDLAAPALILEESGCTVTDIAGNPLDFTSTKDTYARTVSFLAAAPAMHTAVLSVLHTL